MRWMQTTTATTTTKQTATMKPSPAMCWKPELAGVEWERRRFVPVRHTIGVENGTHKVSPFQYTAEAVLEDLTPAD